MSNTTEELRAKEAGVILTEIDRGNVSVEFFNNYSEKCVRFTSSDGFSDDISLDLLLKSFKFSVLDTARIFAKKRARKVLSELK